MVWRCISSFCFYYGVPLCCRGMSACVPFLVGFIWVFMFSLSFSPSFWCFEGGRLSFVSFFCAVRAYQVEPYTNILLPMIDIVSRTEDVLLIMVVTCSKLSIDSFQDGVTCNNVRQMRAADPTLPYPT